MDRRKKENEEGKKKKGKWDSLSTNLAESKEQDFKVQSN